MTNVIHLKSCPRCRGDMMLEQYLGDSEFVCLQCGHRSSPRAAAVRRAIAAAPIKKAA